MSTLTTTATYFRGGLSHVYTGGVGYDGAACVARYAFTTDANGAASLAFRTQRLEPDRNDNHYQPDTLNGFRWLVTREATGYEGACGAAGWQTQAVWGDCLSGSRALSLLPQTSYYLWIFPSTSRYCLWWVGGATVTTEGRYGTPSSLEAADGVFGQPLPITLSRSLSDVTHTVTVDCAGVHTLLLEKSSQYPGLTWEPALSDYAPLLPAAASAPATITAETFCGEESLGTSAVTVTMRIPEGALEPTLSQGWVTLQPCNEGAAAGMHCLIAGMSRAEALFDATKIDTAPLLGATITGFALEAEGETVSAAPYRSPVLTGETVLRLCAIDSRGQRHGESRTVTPLAYAPPTLSLVQVFRCDDAGSPDENGTAIGVSAQLDFSSLGGENRCSLSAALRAPEGQFGPETAMASGALTVIPGQNPDASCECRISATDSLGRSATALRRLPTRRWAMKFRPDGRGVAFGKAPEQTRCLELPGDWQIRLGQESLWLALHPVGSLVLADSAPAEGSWSDQGAVSGTRLWRRTT